MIWFYASDAGIKPVEILGYTEQAVYLPPPPTHSGKRRLTRIREHGAYFATWEEAHGWLVERAASEVRRCRRALESANGRLGNIKGMKPPVAA